MRGAAKGTFCPATSPSHALPFGGRPPTAAGLGAPGAGGQIAYTGTEVVVVRGVPPKGGRNHSWPLAVDSECFSSVGGILPSIRFRSFPSSTRDYPDVRSFHPPWSDFAKVFSAFAMGPSLFGSGQYMVARRLVASHPGGMQSRCAL